MIEYQLANHRQGLGLPHLIVCQALRQMLAKAIVAGHQITAVWMAATAIPGVVRSH